MNWVIWVTKGMIGAKILFWVLFIVAAVYWGSAVVEGVSGLFHGVTARIDHIIEYDQ